MGNGNNLLFDYETSERWSRRTRLQHNIMFVVVFTIIMIYILLSS